MIVAKPASWSSEPDRSGRRTSLREQTANRLGMRNLHVATRLDVGVSGIALIALGRSAHQKATRLQNMQQIKKDYLAITVGLVLADAQWTGPVDGMRKAVTVSHRLGNSGLARFASQSDAQASLLHINPVTGRRHQIRVHAAECGHPLLGDRRYGGPMHYVRTMALY